MKRSPPEVAQSTTFDNISANFLVCFGTNENDGVIIGVWPQSGREGKHVSRMTEPYIATPSILSHFNRSEATYRQGFHPFPSEQVAFLADSDTISLKGDRSM
jgi:hypothetical protein